MTRDKLRHILLVEDDDDHAEIVIRGLATNHQNSVLHRVSDGETALNYLFRRAPYADPATSPRPNVVLLDLRLPRVDGGEVLRTIKDSAELKAIPVVILTTSAAERDVTQAYNQHVNSYLVKPVEFSEFDQMMRSICFYWLGLNYTPHDPDHETRILGTAA